MTPLPNTLLSRQFRSSGQLALGIGLLLPLLLFTTAQFQRPPRTAVQRSLFNGIDYQRIVADHPRPTLIHIITIDLSAPGVEVQVSAGSQETAFETRARTTTDFLTANHLQLGVNANFFYPFEEKTPWTFYPRTGDGVNVLGEAIANGDRYSLPQADWPTLCFGSDSRAQIDLNGTCPAGTQHAIAGLQTLVTEGKPIANADTERAYARVAAGIDRSGDRLWLVVVDGKQPSYSEGVTLVELARIMADNGVATAINLDGGGSTTLAIQTPNGPSLLNAPIHTQLPRRQRPVANHLGFRAAPLPE